MSTITLKPVETETVVLRIKSTSPMIQHKWSEKAIRMMQEKQAGRKTKEREVRDPEAECVAAAYVTEEGEFGIPRDGLKASWITAAHKDLGIEKTLVRKALYLVCNDRNKVLAIQCPEPEMRTDIVRVGNGAADLRYRPEFREWSAEVVLTYDASLLTAEDILNLVNRAGFGVGIGDWRPEKGGEYGRYEVDVEFGVQSVEQ